MARNPAAAYLKERDTNAPLAEAPYNKPIFDALPTVPDPPADFDELERFEWYRILPDMVAAKVLAHSDIRLAEAYCQTSALLTKAHQYLRAEEAAEVSFSMSGKPSQWYGIVDKLNKSLVGIAKSLRLSPESRSIGADKTRKRAASEPTDPLASLDD